MMHQPIVADTSRWCVIRTAGPRTIKLMRSLQAAGIECWSPIVAEKRQKPRCRAKIEVELCLMPSFVFARAAHVAELLMILRQPISPHPQFSLMRHHGEVVYVRDAEMERLRTAENRGAPRAKRRVFEPNASVHLPDGPFAGLTGIVDTGDGRWTLVCFGKIMVKVETCELRGGDIHAPHPEREPLPEQL